MPPAATKLKYGKISKAYILTPSHPLGHGMSVQYEQSIDELTVQVWGYYFDFSFKFYDFFIILRCSLGNLAENVYVKILLLRLIEKISRKCDFCLIIAARPASGVSFIFQKLSKSFINRGDRCTDKKVTHSTVNAASSLSLR